MNINADLHLHSRFSAGTSERMTVEALSFESKKKGIDLIATGDCLHKGWLREIEAMNPVSEGTFELNGTRFVITTEVEDNRRVHHLLFFPGLDQVREMRKRLEGLSKNLDTDGRPNVPMGGGELASMCEELGVRIGPCHAFTPWTAMYAYHDSLESCYGNMADYVGYVELGLSADTSYADRIKELARLTFLTNSDAHSPHPVRIAREFNRFEVKANNYKELLLALDRKGGRKPVLNVGLPPQEGKYNESACIKCYAHYSLTDAQSRRWRCGECGKRIKKGVVDRVNELASYKEPRHPEHRPRYVHLVPLSEIIQKSLGQSSPFTKAVQGEWNRLVKALGSEITILIDAPLDAIQDVARPVVYDGIEAFREGRVIIHPGGGGEYGSIELPGPSKKQKKAPVERKRISGQKRLSDY